MNIIPVVNGAPLRLDTVAYSNAAGERYSVTRFRMYVSSLHATTARAQVRKSDEPASVVEMSTGAARGSAKKVYLVDADEATSLRVEAAVDAAGRNAGAVDELCFDIGVDSLLNCSGVQEGALDPINGMFWSWNTGYIFLKLEGFSPQSTAQGKKLEYHIGGYKAPATCLRTVRLSFAPVKLAASSTVEIDVQADVSRLFGGTHLVRFSELPVVTDFRHAEELADNYKDMFRVREVRVGR
ncbi:MAG: MbnP family protein [Candidatus Kapaibacterium sp.]